MSKKHTKQGGHHSPSNDFRQKTQERWGNTDTHEEGSYDKHSSGRGMEGWVDGLIRSWKYKLKGIFRLGHRRK